MTGLPQRAHVLFYIYCTDTVINTRIFSFTKKNHIFIARSEDTIFILHV